MNKLIGKFSKLLEIFTKKEPVIQICLSFHIQIKRGVHIYQLVSMNTSFLLINRYQVDVIYGS